ncbi:MAG: tetratricopeptide repeat protein [Candidatus Sulfotelmatobacter sp.]
MVKEAGPQMTSKSTWQARHVYLMAVVCLVIGTTMGYLFHGSQSPASAAQEVALPQQSEPSGMDNHTPSLDEMKQMADVKAAPLLEKLKKDPENKDLLIQTGDIYKIAHQFVAAAGYYDKALNVDPKNVAVRTEMASCIYYSGDVDGAIGQLRQALRYDPKDANSLFNLGMIEWQGKQDTKGALAAWQELLKTNPQLSTERNAQVQKLIAEVKGHGKN